MTIGHDDWQRRGADQFALESNTTGALNTALGNAAGDNITTASGVIFGPVYK